MISFKIFGIDKIEPKIVIEAIVALTWFGVAVTGLFEFWKSIPLYFSTDKISRPECWDYFINFFPSILFGAYIYCRYLGYNPKKRIVGLDKTNKEVKGHKGVIFALSKPTISVDKIIEEINKNTEDESIILEELYKMPSVGLFFRILYHHKDTLKVVWPITTRDSKPYKECLDVFLKKFIPSAKIRWQDGKDVDCHIEEDDDAEIIRQTKDILSGIYSSKNLDNLDFEIKKSDVIVDITGGTKTLTTGLVLGALNSEINIQYLTQISGMKDAKVISLSEITPEIILDKIGDYLNELYVNKNESNRLK